MPVNVGTVLAHTTTRYMPCLILRIHILLAYYSPISADKNPKQYNTIVSKQGNQIGIVNKTINAISI